jgi:branched-subunit amino acid ABC-type transport system permease component
VTEFITFTVIGVAIGSIYAIASAGLVVTYTTTGVFNFAHGAIGMFAAFIYWQLRWDEGWGGQWPAPIALIFVLFIVAPLIGVFLQLIVLRGLEGTSETTKLVIPIAVMLGFIGVTNWVWQGAEQRIPKPFFGRNAKWSIGDAFITWHQTIVVIVAVVLAIGLRFILFRTRAGVAMRAVVDNRELVELTGGRPSRSALLSWAIGSMMAAIAGVLISPLLGGLGVLALTLLVVNAYAAAIFGRLRNLPLTFLGGLVIGISVSYWNWISGTGQKWPWLSELRTSLPVVILFVVLLILPHDRLRGARVSRTREWFSVPTTSKAFIWSGVFVVVIAGFSLILTAKWETLLTRGITMSVIGLSMVLLTGYAGEINLAPLAFAGIGAIAAFQFEVGAGVETGIGFATLALFLSLSFGLLVFPVFGIVGKKLFISVASFSSLVLLLVTVFDSTTGSGIASRETMSLTAFVVAALVSGFIGALVALPALRLRGLYMGLATFAFAIFVDKMIYKQRQTLKFNIPFIGDGEDITINIFNNGALNIPRPGFFGIDFVNNQWAMLLLTSLIFVTISILLVILRRSSYGRQLSAMKDSPAACATLGMDIKRLKLSVFTLAAAIAGFGGALHASNLRTIQEDYPFTIWEGLALFMLTVVGGIGYISGALIGGLIYACAFVVMSDFWGKLADDWASFRWLFTVLQDFFLLLGPALAGIGLGKNPSGIASQFFKGFNLLKRKSNRTILILGSTGIVGVWLLRVVEVIDGWTFLLIGLPILLLMPVLGEANIRSEETVNDFPLELAGIEYEMPIELVQELDEKIGLSTEKLDSPTTFREN